VKIVDSYAEQITKADRLACHTLCRKGKARATLRRLSSTVMCLKGKFLMRNKLVQSYISADKQHKNIEYTLTLTITFNANVID
jgi:hypothetical protein